MSENNLKLTKIEESLIVGLQAREREIFREILHPLQDAFKDITSRLEKRLGLPEGAIGRDYDLNQVTWELVPKSVEKSPRHDGPVIEHAVGPVS